jgi:hypothetical protein
MVWETRLGLQIHLLHPITHCRKGEHTQLLQPSPYHLSPTPPAITLLVKALQPTMQAQHQTLRSSRPQTP